MCFVTYTAVQFRLVEKLLFSKRVKEAHQGSKSMIFLLIGHFLKTVCFSQP